MKNWTTGEIKEYREDNKPVLDTLPATVKVYASKDGLNRSIATTSGYTQLKVAIVKKS